LAKGVIIVICGFVKRCTLFLLLIQAGTNYSGQK
jgi:hypothetical protein